MLTWTGNLRGNSFSKSFSKNLFSKTKYFACVLKKVTFTVGEKLMKKVFQKEGFLGFFRGFRVFLKKVTFKDS